MLVVRSTWIGPKLDLVANCTINTAEHVACSVKTKKLVKFKNEPGWSIDVTFDALWTRFLHKRAKGLRGRGRFYRASQNANDWSLTSDSRWALGLRVVGDDFEAFYMQ